MLENLVKELREEYLGEEINLLQLDNKMQQVAQNNELYFNSIFDYSLEELENSFCYLEDSSTGLVNFEFEILNLDEDLEIVDVNVKITNIEVI